MRLISQGFEKNNVILRDIIISFFRRRWSAESIEMINRIVIQINGFKKNDNTLESINIYLNKSAEEINRTD